MPKLDDESAVLLPSNLSPATSSSNKVQLVLYIFDTKVLQSHSALRGKMWPGMDFGQFEASDHGTFVASVASEELNMDKDGIAVVSLAVMDGRPGVGGNARELLNAVHFAVQHRQVFFPHANAVAVMCVAGVSKTEEAAAARNTTSKHGFLFSWYRDWFAFLRPSAFEAALGVAHRNNFLTVLAAGNHYTQAACRAPLPSSTIVVGAYDFYVENKQRLRRRAEYSNFGRCVHVFAPGTYWGASAENEEALQMIGGTSVAAAIAANHIARAWLARNDLSAMEMGAKFLSSLSEDSQMNLDCDMLHTTSTAYSGAGRGAEDVKSCAGETTRRVLI